MVQSPGASQLPKSKEELLPFESLCSTVDTRLIIVPSAAMMVRQTSR